MKPIVTLTLNPCLDQITGVDRVEPDQKLRMDEPHYDPGGGGINVSRAIHRLGGVTRPIYVAGGLMGDLLDARLDDEHVPRRRIEINNNTRINPNVFEHDSEHLYRFMMPGPTLGAEALKKCRELVQEALDDAAYLVISGSLPGGTPTNTYADLVEAAQRAEKQVLLDVSGESLKQAAACGPYLIKPNLRELADLTGTTFKSDQHIIDAGRMLIQEHGIDIVLVSLGGAGAMLITADAHERVASPTVTIRSRVGAGDSLVAGLALSLSRGWELREAVRFGVAAGAAAVMTPGTELCRRDDTERLYDEMTQILKGEAIK